MIHYIFNGYNLMCPCSVGSVSPSIMNLGFIPWGALCRWHLLVHHVQPTQSQQPRDVKGRRFPSIVPATLSSPLPRISPSCHTSVSAGRSGVSPSFFVCLSVCLYFYLCFYTCVCLCFCVCLFLGLCLCLCLYLPLSLPLSLCWYTSTS